ncbi:MAG: PTS sugar transporter subunit IIA [Planctomycetaceae bacterium]|jgi:PTS system nitrogen regulatory IIA component|nr:PTS sugar transporter subunit IIA [Planctomycetaceae bacterium]
MPFSNMSMVQLSRYLHLPEEQVRKLVDRGLIPSRRVNGELVISRDEVHRWLERRIGVSDEVELARVERALDGSVPAGEIEESVVVSSLFPMGSALIPLEAKTRDSAIRSMVRLAMGTGLLWDETAMIDAVKEREELHSTALDNGVALLHPRRPMSGILGDTFLSLGISSRGIPFGGEGKLTDVFFLICSMSDRIHLRILARLSRILSISNFLPDLRQAQTEQEVRDLIQSAEESIIL